MTRLFLALLVFPGLLYAVPMGWLMLGSERKVVARLQGRVGPPLTQGFYDFVKLLAKAPVPRAETFLLTLLPILAVASTLGALALLPVGAGGFTGDLIVFVGLLEMAPLCSVLAGFASRSVYGEVGATREAVLGISGNVPFLAALLALASAAGSLQLAAVAGGAPWVVRGPALLALLACLPVKLRMNPFSVANAEQEILAGPLTEMDGPRLALWELAHALEWVVLAGLVAVLVVPGRGGAFVLVSFAVVPLLGTLAAATARFKIDQAARFLWIWAVLAAVLAFFAAMAVRHGSL
ncbi:respiratory chain complex I subunit 1 family protein [Mesoterricola silvestris]|uniref:Hydrogenase n=1 Tax=Mesoterricola silvestris TaxID=2927979 RepID=A0AA48K9Z0_9BACT|nr:NADH-quinone oxidoreductase subunit H [Mesoterricola silvestris]BDU72802.1 hydrogenase [Mesoterricola silvestris]